MINEIDWNTNKISYEDFISDNSDDYLHRRSFILLKIDCCQTRFNLDSMVSESMVMAYATKLSELQELVKTKYPQINNLRDSDKQGVVLETSVSYDERDRIKTCRFYILEPYVNKKQESKGIMTVLWIKYGIETEVYNVDGDKFLIFNYLTDEFGYISMSECKII